MDVFAQDVFETGAGHDIIASIEEEFWNPGFAPDGQPCTDSRCGFFP